MLTRLDLRGRRVDAGALRSMLPRAGAADVAAAAAAVEPIIADVRERGLAAIRDATAQFDRVELTDIRVAPGELTEALARLDPAVRAALEVAIERVRMVHAATRPAEQSVRVAPGGTVTQRWIPIGRVGIYVPGGLASYPSTVVMNVVPAQVAGVSSLAVTSPPQRATGRPDALVMAACALLGADEVYAVGGAQAIAMLGYGLPGCPPVDLITGPGNVFVTAAKRLLRGLVGIDAEAGPTEVAVLADDTADPGHVAADLISQAEHDPSAASVLVTCSRALADAVDVELGRQIPLTKHAHRIMAALTGAQSRSVLVDDMPSALAVIDAYAPEHLEIQAADAAEVAGRVRAAGAVFVGPYSPASVGDYCAGSNHVLPTGRCARHSGGLSVATFLRSMQVIQFGEAALREVAGHVVALAGAEDLPAHGQAVLARWRS